MVNTNITAVALLTRLFAPGMVERNRGHIINISSIAAHVTYPGKLPSVHDWYYDLILSVLFIHWFIWTYPSKLHQSCSSRQASTCVSSLAVLSDLALDS